MTRRRLLLGIALAAGSLAAMFGPSFADHVRLACDPFRFNDDARHWLLPALRDEAPDWRDGDALVDYRRAMTPPGQALVLRLGSRLMGIAAFSKALPLVQYAVLLACLAWCAARLGGPVCAWAAAALGLSSHVFLYQMAGGTARSWAFPLAGAAAVALLRGSAPALAALTVLGALLYPPSIVVLGLSLALALYGAPMRPARKAALLALTAAACAALQVPALLHAPGRLLGPADVAAYPEVGPGGRYGHDDRPPFLNTAAAVADAFGRSLQGGEPAWIPPLRRSIEAGSSFGRPAPALIAAVAVFGALAGWGTILLARRDPAARRLLILFAASAIAYEAARHCAPLLYFPQRHLIHTIPVLAVLLVPVGIREIVRDRAGARAPALVVAGTLLVLATLGGRGGGANGLTVDARADRALHAAVAALPSQALLAGWPDGVLDDIPWLDRRAVLLNRECHEAIHKDYADEMRRCMAAVIGAYFATSPDPLRTLRERWGVTHLLVDLAHYGPEPPPYFVPFRDDVRAAHAAMRERGSEVQRRMAPATLAQDGTRVLLDLSRLLDTRTEPSAATP
ncbi:MAG: hypothetical protein FJ221_15945 [Lentisphaerae bacterium]|nr:hypothetical protein [Lentisphaerota bacterium]